MTHYVTLSDNDVLFMDDETGDIVVNYDSLPPRVFEGNTVYIHFVEDVEGVQHQYTVNSEDRKTNEVSLNWVQQLNESLLTEAPKFIDNIKNAFNPDMATKIKQGEKAAEKHQKKQDAKFGDMIKLEVSNGKRHNWEFYIQLPNGKNLTTPLFFDDVAIFYKGGNNLNPAIVNATVTLSAPSRFIMRKGKEIYRSDEAIPLAESDTSVAPGYSIPWTKENIAEFKELVEQGSTALKSAVNNALESEKTKSKEQTSEPAVDKTDNTAEAEEKQTSVETDKKTSNRYDLGISSNTYKHFLKILYVLRPKLYDAFDKPVDVSNIKELGEKVKYNNLADFEIEIDGKRTPAIQWIQAAVKNKVLMEKVLNEDPIIKLSDDDMNNPDSVNFKDMIKRATEKEEQEKREAEKIEKQKSFREKYSDVYNELTTINGKESTEDVLEAIFSKIVPSSGKADTVAGEYLRAIMRILYRDYNDGDKFFTGYGLETCGGSAEYLADEQFHEQISEILEDALRLADDDDAYTSAITTLAQDVLDYLVDNEDLFYTENEIDSRDYSYEYIEEHQPMYEFECYGSDDIVTLVDKGVLNSWDLKNYVEDILSYESVFRGAETERPWGHHDTSVTVSNLTRDGLERLEDSFERNVEGFWEGLVEEHADELADSDEDDYDEYDDDMEVEED